jgi:hypothetical protein
MHILQPPSIRRSASTENQELADNISNLGRRHNDRGPAAFASRRIRFRYPEGEPALASGSHGVHAVELANRR